MPTSGLKRSISARFECTGENMGISPQSLCEGVQKTDNSHDYASRYENNHNESNHIHQTQASFSNARLEEAKQYRQVQPYRKLWTYAKKIELIIRDESHKESDNDLSVSSTASMVSDHQSPSKNPLSKSMIFESIGLGLDEDHDDDGDFGLYELDDNTNSNIDISYSPKPKPNPQKRRLLLGSQSVKEKRADPTRILCIYEHVKSYTSCRSFVTDEFSSSSNLNTSVLSKNTSMSSKRTEVNISVTGFRIFQHINSGIGDVQYKIKCSINGIENLSEIWKSFSDFQCLAIALEHYVYLKFRTEIVMHKNELKKNKSGHTICGLACMTEERQRMESRFEENYVFRECLKVWNELMRMRPCLTKNISVSYLMVELCMIETFMEKVFFDIPSLEMLEEFMSF